VASAKGIDPRAHLAVLLGGDAGMRCGEIMALAWGDVNVRKGQICVERSDWRGCVTTTKGGRLRYVPMTTRLAEALRAHRHLRSERVLCQERGEPPHAEGRAGLRTAGGAQCTPAPCGRPHAARHVLFAPGHAWRTGSSHPRVGRPHGSRHHAEVHAPKSVGDGQRDKTARGS